MLVKLGRGLTIGNCGGGQEQGESSSPYLDSVESSVCCDLDATIAASYGGSGQTWANLIASPADGAAQADYDFYLGADGAASTDDPAFTGAAGDAAAYFALDGGDHFVSKLPVASQPPTFKNITKEGVSFWMAFAFKLPVNLDVTTKVLFENGTISGGGNCGLQLFYRDSQQVTEFVLENETSTGGQKAGATAYIEGADNIMIFSYDYAANTYRVWTNSATAETGYASPQHSGTRDAAAPAGLFARQNGGLPWQNGTRVYSFAAGNAFLDNARAAAIISHLEARHGRSYL